MADKRHRTAALIHNRQVSAREVIETRLRRIDAVNLALNEIVIRLDEQALAAADAADRAVAAADQLPRCTERRSPSRGATTWSAPPPRRAGRSWQMSTPAEYPGRYAPDVERLKAAGTIPIGRQFGMRIGIEPAADVEP